MIVVIIVLGVLATLALPVYTGVRNASLESAAFQNARLINAARESYALSVPSGYTRWIAAATDQDRLALLIQQNLLSGAVGDYVSMPGGFSVSLRGELRARTILLRNDVPVEY